MTDGDFRVVRRKKFSRSNHKNNFSHESDDTEQYFEMVEISKFLGRLQRIRDTMVSRSYFLKSIEIVNKSMKELGFDRIEQIVCFGIGPFGSSYQALHQFAFLLELQKYLSVTDALYFDPLFRQSEKEVLKSVGCSLTGNCDGQYPVDRVTLFYIPHCPVYLTNNLLWKNWNQENLSKALVINNSFTLLLENSVLRMGEVSQEYISDIHEYTHEFVLENCYENSTVFNDLSLHIFPRDRLPPEDSNFWKNRKKPLYKGSTEIELIEQFRSFLIRNHVVDMIEQ